MLGSSGTNGVNIAAQPDDVVTLRGLDIHGAPSAGAACVNPGSGIRIASAGKVRIEDSRIDQWQRAVWVQPTSAVDVLINRVDIANNCAGGVIAEPAAAGSARVTIANSSISNSVTALSAGPRSEAWIGGTTVFGNAPGSQTVGDGKITDWGDNRFSGNTADGAPTTQLGAPPAGPQGATGPAAATGPAGPTG